MERWRNGWNQIGGPNALTKWSWILTLPLALIISNVYEDTPTPTEVVVWLSIVLLAHCILGVLMWLAWLTVLSNRPRRSRPITALLVFGAIGTMRGLLMQLAQDFTGIGGTDFLERMGVNVLGSVVVLSAIAIVIDDFRVDAEIKARLEEANRTLTAVRNQEQDALRAADKDVLDRVQAAVEAALSESGATSERCRQVSEEIVRPISHELAEARSAPALIIDPPPETKLTFTEAFAATAAPSPLAIALLLETAAFGAVLGGYGLPVALANYILGGAALYLGGCAFRRYIHLPERLLLRVLIIAMGFALIGGVSALLVPPLISRFIAPFNVQILGPMAGTAAAALIVTLGTAVITGRRQRLDEMAAAIAESASSVEQLHVRVGERRIQASRFLHGPIQSELVAAAVRGESPSDVKDVVKRRFHNYGALEFTRSPKNQMNNLLQAWSSILHISSTIDDNVWGVLSGDVARAELMTDVLSEGFTNALRHASGQEVCVDLALSGDRIVIRIMTVGSLSPSGQLGIGLALIQRRGGDVKLASDGEHTSLTVSL